jgi:hypothetical protein
MSDICPTSSKRVRLDDAPARVLVQRSAVTFVQMVGEDYSIKAYCVEHESSELADELFTWIHSFDADVRFDVEHFFLQIFKSGRVELPVSQTDRCEIIDEFLVLNGFTEDDGTITHMGDALRSHLRSKIVDCENAVALAGCWTHIDTAGSLPVHRIWKKRDGCFPLIQYFVWHDRL